MFVDRVEVNLQAGRGGDGCLSFRRERYVPKGGPDGGDGGRGGSIIILAEAGVDNLAELAHRKFWKAKRGTNGMGANRHGRNGEDVTLKVPPGTILRDARENFVIKDLAEGEQVVAARGGKGGKGNVQFKSSTNRAPRQFTRGEDGEERQIIFELKTIADVGLVGLPNAGKSTLLSRMSQARPEIANYPFTTKRPHLGRVQIDMDRSFILADIPGLIEGAHSGVGLGHEFLRHVERTRLLIHLVEPLPMDQSDPIENYHTIRSELQQYDSNLAKRPEIVAVSKAELPEAEEIRDRLARDVESEVMLISAVTGVGLNKLKDAAWQKLQNIKQNDAVEPSNDVEPNDQAGYGAVG